MDIALVELRQKFREGGMGQGQGGISSYLKVYCKANLMARKMKISRNRQWVIRPHSEPHAQRPGSLVLSNSVCFTEDKNKNLKVNIPVIYVDIQTTKHSSDVKGFYFQLSLMVPECDRKHMSTVPSMVPVPVLPHF